jgi:hypothetical protein
MNSLERSQWWSYTTQLLSQVLKSKAMMHPNPWCRINPCYLWNATLQSYNRHAIVGSFLDISNMMYCWDVNGGWPFVLYKHSSHMLVKEQPVIWVQEDLILTRGQVKLTQSGLCDSYLSPSSMSGLRFWEPNTSSPSMWSTWVQNLTVLGIFAIASSSTLRFLKRLFER